MEKNASRIVHVILAVLTLVVFFTMPIYKMGDKEITGENLMKGLEHDTPQMILFVAVPILAIVLTVANKYWRGFVAFAVFLCPILLKGALGPESKYVDFAAGSVVYMLLGVIMAVVAFTSKSDETVAAVDNTAPSPLPKTDSQAVSAVADASGLWNAVSEYDDAKLVDIVNNKMMYNADLVKACEEEQQKRKDAESFRSVVESKSDEELRAFIANPQTYNSALIYCSIRELKRREEPGREEPGRD